MDITSEVEDYLHGLGNWARDHNAPISRNKPGNQETNRRTSDGPLHSKVA